MQVYLHQEYRQFRRLRTVGEIITARDGVGAGLVTRGAACPVVDGLHQCQVVGAPQPVYLDEQLDSPEAEVMLPAKWSLDKRTKMRNAMHRSKRVRAQLLGKDFRDLPVGRMP